MNRLGLNRTVQGVAGAIYGIVSKTVEERIKTNGFQGTREYNIFEKRGGSSSLSLSSSHSCPHARTPPPDFMAVYRFIYSLFRRAQVEPECLIASLVYLERFLSTIPAMSITGHNWERMIFTAIMIASKHWDDVSCSSKSFCLCANGTMTLRELNAMERLMLKVLDYNLYISSETYRVVYYDLKKIWMNMVVDESAAISPAEQNFIDGLDLPDTWGKYYTFNCPTRPPTHPLDGGEGIGSLTSPRRTFVSVPSAPTTTSAQPMGRRSASVTVLPTISSQDRPRHQRERSEGNDSNLVPLGRMRISQNPPPTRNPPTRGSTRTTPERPSAFARTRTK